MNGEADWVNDKKINRTNNRNYSANADPRGSVKPGVQGGLVRMRAGEQVVSWLYLGTAAAVSD